MQRISAWSDLVAPGGLFRYGSLALGVPPTPLAAEWLNMLQEELAHVVVVFGEKDFLSHLGTAVLDCIGKLAVAHFRVGAVKNR